MVEVGDGPNADPAVGEKGAFGFTQGVEGEDGFFAVEVIEDPTADDALSSP